MPYVKYLSHANSDDFELDSNTVSTALEAVASHTIPRGLVRQFVTKPGRLTLGALQEFDGDGVTTAFVISAGTVVSNPRGFYQPVVAIVDGTEQTYTTGSPGAGEFSYTASTQTVTFGTAPASGTDNVDIYFPFAEGAYTVEVFSENGRQRETFVNGPIRRLNSAPQDDVNSAWGLRRPTPLIPQDAEIRILVRSTVSVNWDDENPYSQIELPYMEAPITSMDPSSISEGMADLGS